MARFAHIADCHLGGWRDDRLRVLGLEAFRRAVSLIIKKECDFVVLAGDFFNTAMPHIDVLKFATRELARLKTNGIPVYFIAGSHDYSPSGRSMLHVLENANLMTDVQKARIEDDSLILEYTIDKKTGIKIAGLPGKKGALEKEYYQRLDYDLARDEPGTKIFLFHMLLEEFNTNNNISDVPMSILPEGFSYYAGGHPHIVEKKGYGSGIIAYPGPLFPNNFEELERLMNGGFYIAEIGDDGNASTQWISMMEKKVRTLRVNVKGETPEEVSEKIIGLIKGLDMDDVIFLLRVHGEIDGRVSDISWERISSIAAAKGAYAYSRNAYGLKTKDEETEHDVQADEHISDEELIEKHMGTSQVFGRSEVMMIFNILSQEKREAETRRDFASRMNEEISKALSIPEIQKSQE